MAKKITLEQIAQRLGTSKITVSRALKGQAGVSDGLRQQIFQTATDMGYEQQHLRTAKRKRRIVFLTPKRFYLVTDSFYHVIYYHLNILCSERNIEFSPFILEKENELQGILPDSINDCDDIIIGGEVAQAVIDSVAATAKPYVVVDYDPMDSRSDCVIIDNYRIGKILTEYLVRRGYKTVGFVGALSQSSNIADRILGYRKILYSRNLPVRSEWQIDNYDRETDNYLIDIPLPAHMPEAFICHCDRAAYYFMEKLKSSGISVPDQIALISIDNTELASSTSPALTSMDIDKHSFAEETLRLLDEREHGRTTPKRVYLETRLIERDSVPER
jgi:LacI family transcriptional regulator